MLNLRSCDNNESQKQKARVDDRIADANASRPTPDPRSTAIVMAMGVDWEDDNK